MYDFLIHSGSGIDDPALIGGADTLDAARAIARRELERWPDQIVTIVDKDGGECSINPPGRPPKSDTDKSVRINITLTPEALELIDAQDGNRSALIDGLIRKAWG